MIDVYWHNRDKRIIQLDYKSELTGWNEYHAAVNASYRMAQEAGYPTYIVHNPGSVAMPGGNAILHVRQAVQRMPESVDGIIVLIENTFARRITEVVIKVTLFRQPVHFIDSLDEAYSLVDEMQVQQQESV
jgi:hypothetical protein